ncbi:MAG: N-acetylmuramoyl-L-alanine amidase [Bradyrhizobiaceae bacterium]|nr:MAG: N-acetylmuramoyl-L-alanine amidase [Bradyrhizobiaceae bacterium]
MNIRAIAVLQILLALAAPAMAQSPTSFETAARSRGTPDIPGLNMVWLVPWTDLRHARDWRNIVVHQSEGAVGSAFSNAVAQMKRQNRKGVTIWVETDGTAYWSAAEWAVPNHLRDGNRNDNKYIDNASTYRQIDNESTIGVEFVGNYPNVRKPPTEAQIAAWRVLVRVLQVRYDIPTERVFAHNWIDYKDRRYCEGCELARIARTQGIDQGFETAQQVEKGQ